MNAEQRKLARHFLGLPNDRRQSYRNRFYASRGHDAWEELHRMAGEGWVNMQDTRSGRETFFWLTPMGAVLALDAGETLDPEDFPKVAA